VAIGLALLLDILFGDPPNRYHPVAWMGSAIAAAKRHAPAGGNAHRFIYGVALDILGAGLVAGIGYVLQRLLSLLPAPLRWVGEALALKMMFSLHGLGAAAGEVKAALDAGDLPEARRRVSWHLVSRDTSTLDAAKVAAATVESVAENTSDGVIAPLFYYAVGGLPGALAYRFLNTADSMLGYRDPEHEWLGKAPARIDDAANLIPARLTALLFVLAALIGGADARRALRVWWGDRHKTASPNAGHPMSAMSGALGVELGKVDHYCLGRGQRAATSRDVGRSVRLMHIATALGAGLLVGLPLLCRLVKEPALNAAKGKNGHG
jgi:adenosylcobinamide-phosphate synthase